MCQVQKPKLMMMIVIQIVFALLSVVHGAIIDQEQPKQLNRIPHIVLIVLDSVGKGDLFASEDRMGYSTPGLNRLANVGAVLRNYYVQTESSPTRAALLTGKYPYKLGLQEQLVTGTTAHIPLNVPTLPELLRASQNYECHLVGGWGLGGARVEYTPTMRGFDTFYGFLGSQIDFYNKTRGKGIDFWDEIGGFTRYKRPDWSAQGNYSTHQYRVHTRRVLETYVQRNPTRTQQEESPLFLMIAHQAPGAGIMSAQDQQLYSNRCKKSSKARKGYCSAMMAVDDAVADLFDALNRLALWDNTLLVLSSDSGGMAPIRGFDDVGLPLSPGSTGSNYPFRGSKSTLFEGGVRGQGLVSGGALQVEARGKFYDSLAHAVDVPVFILSAVYQGAFLLKNPGCRAGLARFRKQIQDLDGSGLTLQGGQIPLKAPRTEIPINVVSSGFDFTAIRFGRWKLIVGSTQIYRTGDGWWPSSAEGSPQLPKPERHRLFSPYKLFDLIADPYEHENMRNFSEVIKDGRARIFAITRSSDFVEPQLNVFNPFSLPILHGGAWAPFLGDDHLVQSALLGEDDHFVQPSRDDITVAVE